jgi:isoquinoline 1-oxidoreductase subunit beta
MTTISRRQFVVFTTATVAGFGLGLGSAGCGDTTDVREEALRQWILLRPDGLVTIRVNCVDMGQGAQTGLAQIVADEMDADWNTIRIEMAPVTRTFMSKDGSYYTGGSQSIRTQFDLFSRAGATARAMLIAAAAKKWRLPVTSLRANGGEVIHGASGRRIGYGALAGAAARLPVPADVALKPAGARVLIGKPVAPLGLAEKVTGKAIYGIDVRLPGMLTATLAQCPYFEGRLAAVDEAPALAVRGVLEVVKFPHAVVVVAADFWSAKKGLNALEPQWTKPQGYVASDAALFAELQRNLGAPDSFVAALDKDTEAAVVRVETKLKTTRKFMQADYQVPLLSHSSIEPMNAVAQVSADRCTLWAPMQAQADMLDALSRELGLPKKAISLNTTKLGGGFGRRLQVDYGVLAAKVAKAVGRPVRLLWTREEDMTHDYYRPAAIGRVRAALDDDLSVQAIDYTGATVNDVASGGFARNYPFPDAVIRLKRVDLPVTVGSWRSVDPSVTAFFIESFVDEIAQANGLDPLAYRQRLLKGDPRGLRTLNAVAQMANWGHAPTNHHQGIAFFGSSYWGTAVAEIVELSVDANKRIKLHKAYCAIDPGTAINPRLITAQVEGGMLFGLSAALSEAITLKDGATEQRNFDSYTPLRFPDAPPIEVMVLESAGAEVGGIGEPPVPPAAPALVNAIFAATGQRIRKLPLSASGFVL